jgi:hypothetical protein
LNPAPPSDHLEPENELETFEDTPGHEHDNPVEELEDGGGHEGLEEDDPESLQMFEAYCTSFLGPKGECIYFRP